MTAETFVTVADTIAVIGSVLILAPLFLTAYIIVKCARHGRKR